MEIAVIGFVPPVSGVDTEFNTFRLGQKYSKTLTPGQEVFLMDEKNKVVFGRAEVLRIETGKLGELCLEHAEANHRELGSTEPGAPERLFHYLQKLFGPHIATVSKKSCVIYMRRIE